MCESINLLSLSLSHTHKLTHTPVIGTFASPLILKDMSVNFPSGGTKERILSRAYLLMRTHLHREREREREKERECVCV
jgi:hypothetical protein